MATLLVRTPAWAQRGDREIPGVSFLQQQREIDQKIYDERAQGTPIESLLDWQWGGWIDYYLFDFDDGIQSQRVYQRPSLVAWTRITIDDDAHEFFARGRLTFNYFNPGDEYTLQSDWVGPNLDRGWYRIDVGHALRLTKPADPYQLNVRIGRQDVTFGTGYALDLPLDAVWLDARLHDFRINTLFGKTIASYPNVDRDDPVDSHSNRCFLGVQASYEGFERHVPFIYALWNNDATDERPQNPFQAYSYDTEYFGFGSRGELAHNLNYWAEGVFEFGHGYGLGDYVHRTDVNAWGWDLGAEYLFDLPSRPRVSGEYMFASGDPDRIFSPTNATGGNSRNRQDTSFIAFGYRDTGLDSGLALSNLHIWRAGAACSPLEQVELLRQMEIGTNWFLYQKNRSRGAISDTTAQEFEGYVGWEMDYFINWRLGQDLSWTLRWGMFFPGTAYADRDGRSFLFTGVTWSF
jgi:hypothetical protein